jgi:hypothetical protein
LRTFVDQMKKEMQNRKVILDEELLRLKKLVVEALDNELTSFATSTTSPGNEKIISDRDLQEQRNAEQTLLELEESASFHLYVPDTTDHIDFAVAQALKSINCPVRMEIERISQGEYLADKKLLVRIMNNQLVSKCFYYFI